MKINTTQSVTFPHSYTAAYAITVSGNVGNKSYTVSDNSLTGCDLTYAVQSTVGSTAIIQYIAMGY